MKHTLGMHLIKETLRRGERCAQPRRLHSSATLVTTSPSRGQKQTSEDLQITLDLLLKHKKLAPVQSTTGGHLSYGQGCGFCSQPRLSRIQHRSQRKWRYLKAGGG